MDGGCTPSGVRSRKIDAAESRGGAPLLEEQVAIYVSKTCSSGPELNPAQSSGGTDINL